MANILKHILKSFRTNILKQTFENLLRRMFPKSTTINILLWERVVECFDPRSELVLGLSASCTGAHFCYRWLRGELSHQGYPVHKRCITCSAITKLAGHLSSGQVIALLIFRFLCFCIFRFCIFRFCAFEKK